MKKCQVCMDGHGKHVIEETNVCDFCRAIILKFLKLIRSSK